jgi:hypothetical protein
VAKMTSIKLLFALETNYYLEVQQMDINATFLHDKLKEKIFIKKPEGFVVEGREDTVCELKRWMYGMKKSPTQWY